MVLQAEISQNLIPNDPELADVLSMHRKGIFLDLNCHHVGTVQSFDATTQTAKVTINYKRTYFKPNAMGVVMPELRDYPVIADAPVIILGGGGFAMTFPVAAGDECLVMFNDRDFDAWFAGASSAPNPTARLHSFSDAVVLVGLRSLQNIIVSYDTDGVAIRNRLGTVKFLLNDNGVTVSTGPAGVALLLDNAGKVSITNTTGEFVAALIQILTTGQAGGFPFILDPTSLATLQSFQAV